MTASKNMAGPTFVGQPRQVEVPDLSGTGNWDILIFDEDNRVIYESWSGARSQHVIRRLNTQLKQFTPWWRNFRIRQHFQKHGVRRAEFGVFNVSRPISGNTYAPYRQGKRHTLLLEDDAGKVWEATLDLGGFRIAAIATYNAGAERRVEVQVTK